MPRSNDPLNQLLRKALHEQRGRPQPTPPPRPLPPRDPVCDLYSSPLNWTQGKRVSLIHRSSDGRETFLGVFTELLNERAKVRRLVRDHEAKAHGPLPREIVSGPYWLRSQVHVPPADSSEELRSIRERFLELMKEHDGWIP